jgi:hypothetical protein
MTAPDAGHPAPSEADRVRILAPYRRDAALLQETLQKYDTAANVCADGADLARELMDEGAIVVMSQDTLIPRTLDALAGRLAAQPAWSEMPLIVLLDGIHQKSAVLNTLRAQLPTSKLTILQRPVRTVELVTAVQTAVAARRRQFQLRDHIAWQEELQRELSHRVKNVLANVVASIT